MALSLTNYTSDGAQREYAVPFIYIKREYVKAYSTEIDEKGLVAAERTALPFEWLNDGLIRLGDPPPAGHRVTVERETYAERPLVDFQDAAQLVEEDLDLSALQSLHVAQEARDRNNYEILEASRNVLLATEEVKDHSARAETAADAALDALGEAQGHAGAAQAARDDALAALAGTQAVADAAREDVAAAGSAVREYVERRATEIDETIDAAVTTITAGVDATRDAVTTAQRIKDEADSAIALAHSDAERAEVAAEVATTAAGGAEEDALMAGLARDRAERAQTDAVAARNAASAAEVRAKEWADNPPWLEVEPGHFSARHHADRAAAVSDLTGHDAATDPHPQYLRKDEVGSEFFAFDEFGDIVMREDIQVTAVHPLFHVDAWGDVALKP